MYVVVSDLSSIDLYCIRNDGVTEYSYFHGIGRSKSHMFIYCVCALHTMRELLHWYHRSKSQGHHDIADPLPIMRVLLLPWEEQVPHVHVCGLVVVITLYPTISPNYVVIIEVFFEPQD